MLDEQGDTIDFRPLSAEFAQDPYPTYAAMRKLDRPYFYEGEKTWMLTRFADVQEVALDKSMLRVVDENLSETEKLARKTRMNMHDMPHHERFVQNSLLDSEGDTHARLRKVVFREFTPAIVERQRVAVQDIVNALLDKVSNQSEIDFIADFAAHVPGHIIGRVLGVPADDSARLRKWSEDIVSFWNIGRTQAGKDLAENATREFYEYLSTLLDQRAVKPQDDLLTRMFEAKQAGELTEDELVALAMQVLRAGHGSTIDTIGSGMHALLQFPDQMARLRAKPELMKTAIQEMFRYNSPLPYFHRFATRDVTVGGYDYPAGTRFGLLYGAANRDPAQFDDPDVFDVGRSPNRHISFGGGTHFCLGNHLARLDMDVIFNTLFKRYSEIELVDENPEYKRGLSVRGPKTLMIKLKEA